MTSPVRHITENSGWSQRNFRRFPGGRATVKDFVNHIDYAVKLIGVDHVAGGFPALPRMPYLAGAWRCNLLERQVLDPNV